MKTKTINKLKRVFYNPSHVAGFASIDKLYKAFKGKISKENIVKFLAAQDTYTLHRQRRKNIKPRNKYFVTNIDDIWQADLVQISNVADQNKDYNYLLTCIDIFSKYAFAEPIKSKSAKDVKNGFANILKAGRKPLKLMTDKGSEFRNTVFQDFLKKNEIKYYTSNNPDTKAAVIERWNKTLRGKITRFATYKNTNSFIDVLPQLVKSYNKSVHSTTGFAPSDVNETNVLQVFRNTYRGVNFFKSTKPKFKIGDHVRISREKSAFEKDSFNYSEEIFVIDKIIRRNPVVYKLKDLNKEEIVGTFYEAEMILVVPDKNKLFKIDKILKTKGTGASKQHFVSWKGYPASFNSWILDKDLKKI